MVNASIRRFRTQITEELRRSFSEEYTPRQIAGSFAIGVFITMLPTLGTGLLVFVVLSYLFAWINKIALFAAVLVLNPVVKWGVYAGSVALGIVLLGPVEGVAAGDVSAAAGEALLVRLLVGNLILAVLTTVLAYVLVHRLAAAYQEEAQLVVDAVIEEIEEEIIE